MYLSWNYVSVIYFSTQDAPLWNAAISVHGRAGALQDGCLVAFGPSTPHLPPLGSPFSLGRHLPFLAQCGYNTPKKEFIQQHLEQLLERSLCKLLNPWESNNSQWASWWVAHICVVCLGKCRWFPWQPPHAMYVTCEAGARGPCSAPLLLQGPAGVSIPTSLLRCSLRTCKNQPCDRNPKHQGKQTQWFKKNNCTEIATEPMIILGSSHQKALFFQTVSSFLVWESVFICLKCICLLTLVINEADFAGLRGAGEESGGAVVLSPAACIWNPT